MNCCDAYGNCRQGRDCPVRLGDTKVIESISREINAQIEADQQQRATQVVRNTFTPLPEPVEQPYQWLDDLFFKVLSRALLALSAVIATGCAGYVYQHCWGR